MSYKEDVMSSLQLETDDQFKIVEALRYGKVYMPAEVIKRFKDFEAEHETCSLDIQAQIIAAWVKENYPKNYPIPGERHGQGE